MALHHHEPPRIKKGWVRAFLLLIAYVTLSLLLGLLINIFTLKKGIGFKEFSGPALNNPSVQIWLAASLFTGLICVFFFRKYIDREKVRPLSFSFIHPNGTVGFLLGLLLICAGSLIIFFTNNLEWTDVDFSPADMFTSLVLLIMVAFGEEWVFRGYVLHNLLKSFNTWIALGISALLFALIHSSNPDVHPIALANVFLAGLLTGLSYIQTRNLWFPIFFHFCWNFFQGPILGFPVSGLQTKSLLILNIHGNALITGGNFGFEASIVCTILLLISLLGLYYLNPFPQPASPSPEE